MKKTHKSAHDQRPPERNTAAQPGRKEGRARPAFGEVMPSVQQKGYNEFIGDERPLPDGTVFWEVGVDKEGGVMDVTAQIDAELLAHMVRIEDKLDTLLTQRRRNA